LIDNFTIFNVTFIIFIPFVSSLPSKPKVFVILPPPLYPPFPYEMNETVINEIFPVLLPEIASVSGATGVIDVFSALGGAALSQPGITCDGCHPVNPGYLEAAQTIFVKLANMISQDSRFPPPVYTPGLSFPENFAPEELTDGVPSITTATA